jgi:hypothetical protein
VKLFLADPTFSALYGFSGGGYNLRYILVHLASHTPDALHRIDLVVVLGSPLQPKSEYQAFNYNVIARRKVHPAKWEPANWDVVYKTDPPKSALPKGLPKGTTPHMFGPDILLAETPAGRYRDWQVDDDD